MRLASRFTFLVLLAAVALVAAPGQAQLAFLVINEVDSDTPSVPVNDDMEFIELYDGGIGNQSLAGYCIVFYNGNGDTAYFAMDLTGSTDANGYYVVGNPAVTPAPAQTFPLNTLQNGADAVAVYFAAAAAFPAGTLVTTTGVVDAVVYDTSDPDDPGLLVLTPAQPQVDENVNANSGAESIGRCPNGQGGPLITSGWTAFVPSPSAPNNCPVNVYSITISQFGGCGTPINFSVVNAAPNAELYNLISLACSTPAGSGPLFGLDVGPGSGDPLSQIFLPLGSVPFHVNADVNGSYALMIPTLNCPGLVIQIEAVSIQVIGFSVTAITQTTGCVGLAI